MVALGYSMGVGPAPNRARRREPASITGWARWLSCQGVGRPVHGDLHAAHSALQVVPNAEWHCSSAAMHYTAAHVDHGACTGTDCDGQAEVMHSAEVLHAACVQVWAPPDPASVGTQGSKTSVKRAKNFRRASLRYCSVPVGRQYVSRSSVQCMHTLACAFPVLTACTRTPCHAMAMRGGRAPGRACLSPWHPGPAPACTP